MKNSNTNHTTVTLNLIQSLFKFNKLSNGDTCQGLLRRFVHKITNSNKISPHNDMDNKNGNRLINLSTYRLIDLKNVKTLMPFKKKIAFTLAETLITLGIIGVVAAMTIPNLITTHQKKVMVVKLQKSISILNQAYKLSVAEQGQPEVNDILNLDIKDYFNKYWAPFLKYSTYCNTPMDCGYKSRFFKQLDGENYSFQMTNAANFTFQTNEGFVYSIQIRGFWDGYPYFNGTVGTNGTIAIVVDLNGSKGPNTFGKDVFYLTGSNFEDIGIQPYGYQETNDVINEDCSKSGTGRYCAEKIKRAGWEIDKGYPW